MRTASLDDLRGQECGCPTCGLIFGGLRGFERHRVGEHGVNRRCLSVAELGAIGYELDSRGRWRRFEGRNSGHGASQA